jgi:hypothetical protein
MQRPFRVTLVAVTCLLGLSLAPGCTGAAKVRVAGRITKSGQPMKIDEKTLVTLTFAPDMAKPDQSYTAKYRYDNGTYEVELPPGKYRANCIIAEKKGTETAIVQSTPEAQKKIYDFTSTQDNQDIDIGSK